MSTLPPATDATAVARRPLVPKDAATLVVIDRTGPAPRILMGRRRRDLAFLPGVFVFPGGRVDDVDRTPVPLSSDNDLAPDVLGKLLTRMRGRASANRARALARAAVRETREETGLVIGAGDSLPLSQLAFIARAITPPGRVRRYDTRFFMADASLVAGGELAGDGELADLDWFTLPAVRGLELPGITRLVVEDIAERLERGSSHSAAPDVPFYFHRAGQFERAVL